jgi:hypothetical protein
MTDEITGDAGHSEIEDKYEKERAEWFPKAGDRLFVASDAGACLDPLHCTLPGEPRAQTGRWQLYVGGFLTAADRLVEAGSGDIDQDELIYPIFTLYRHHLELQLKWAIRWSPGCTDETRKWLAGTHSLRELWDKLAEVYPRFSVWTTPECTEACHQSILEFDCHDPNSQASRFPEDKEGNPTLTRLDVVDLPTLKLGINKISHYLSAIVMQIGQDHEWEAEMAGW